MSAARISAVTNTDMKKARDIPIPGFMYVGDAARNFRVSDVIWLQARQYPPLRGGPARGSTVGTMIRNRVTLKNITARKL